MKIVVASFVVALALLYAEDSGLKALLDGLFGNVFGASKPQRAARPEAPRPHPQHADGVDVVDLASMSLPKIRMHSRVMDLVHGQHFDTILQDTPDDVRPPGVVVFYNSDDETCMKKYKALRWDNLAETVLPARERLFTARYDTYAAPKRVWYKFTPEMDLEKRFDVDACPQVVFIPRKCDGFTEWCSRGEDPENPGTELIGCADFKEQCTGTRKWTGKGDLTAWIKKQIRKEGEPKILKQFATYAKQGEWIKNRDRTTCNTQLRNIYLAEAFPAFTKRGYLAVETPKEFQKWLLEFLERHKDDTITEGWDTESTQLSHHENPTKFVNLDMEYDEKVRMSEKYIKPIVEKWANVADLELTSFYGIRIYPDGAWLRNHVDRIDTHVLSVTLSVQKGDEDKANSKPWPLEVIDWNGDHVRYNHPGGTMVLYESSKLAHGRPYRNMGGPHVGCFIHYKPKSMHSSDASKWEEIVTDARANQNHHSYYASYKSTKSVEPDNAVYTGDDITIQGKEEKEVGAHSVTFKNSADRGLDLHWVSDSGELVKQATIGASSSSNVDSFVGHKFTFTEVGSLEPLPGASFTIDQGKKVYKYSFTKDGKMKAPSKYAKMVKEKLKSEF
mmetsp:Transcript_18492/g.30145  ORF Transcript_18492/g.30145 Transcript_18492/m.30145 type:complete len:616 (+) Transcript_18492:1-1848(+)